MICSQIEYDVGLNLVSAPCFSKSANGRMNLVKLKKAGYDIEIQFDNRTLVRICAEAVERSKIAFKRQCVAIDQLKS